MKKEQIQRLLDRFHAGGITDEEKNELEVLLTDGSISLEDLHGPDEFERKLMQLESPSTSDALDKRFYAMLAAEQQKLRPASWISSFSWPRFAPRFALASLMLIGGLAAGYFLRMPGSTPRDEQIAVLSQQVSDLQEMMMLSLLEKGSATERLKAVGLTQEMDEASKKVTNALIQTLNQDENVNVRLAALEALKPYATDSSVREALIRSIARQESPLVQVSLAELMVALQEKGAIKEFERIVESEKTPTEVKNKLRESIEVLI